MGTEKKEIIELQSKKWIYMDIFHIYIVYGARTRGTIHELNYNNNIKFAIDNSGLKYLWLS